MFRKQFRGDNSRVLSRMLLTEELVQRDVGRHGFDDRVCIGHASEMLIACRGMPIDIEDYTSPYDEFENQLDVGDEDPSREVDLDDELDLDEDDEVDLDEDGDYGPVPWATVGAIYAEDRQMSVGAGDVETVRVRLEARRERPSDKTLEAWGHVREGPLNVPSGGINVSIVDEGLESPIPVAPGPQRVRVYSRPRLASLPSALEPGRDGQPEMLIVIWRAAESDSEGTLILKDVTPEPAAHSSR